MSNKLGDITQAKDISHKLWGYPAGEAVLRAPGWDKKHLCSVLPVVETCRDRNPVKPKVRRALSAQDKALGLRLRTNASCPIVMLSL